AEKGRIFISRLEDGDLIPDAIENLAEKEGINSAVVFFLGGADKKSKVVVGPEETPGKKLKSRITELKGISEAVGIGTIFSDEEGKPKLHLHAVFGHKDKTITGCTRKGVKTWLIGEVIIMELINHNSLRKLDLERDLKLLKVN
ncbi:MAG: PPC domain-containing DNA-binding protein, partial [Bacillota bacterium]